MERWRQGVAVVSGAASGNGAAIAQRLLDAGLTVVGLDIDDENIRGAVEAARQAALGRARAPLTATLSPAPSPASLHTVKCDVTKEEDVLNAFKWVRERLGRVDILVNNAGVLADNGFSDMDSSLWRNVLNVNVLGLSICAREGVKLMREKGVDGHIVNIGSICGHALPARPGLSVYHASKHAVRVLTEGLRKELVAAKSKIRVTVISPSVVKTNMGKSFTHVSAEELYSDPHLFPEDVADAVLYAVSAPTHVQIHDIILRAVGDIF